MSEINRHSEEWRAERQRIKDSANAKRSEATKEQPRNEDGTVGKKPVREQVVPAPVRPSLHPTRKAVAEASHTNPGAASRAMTLRENRHQARTRRGRYEPTRAGPRLQPAIPGGNIAALFAVLRGAVKLRNADPSLCAMEATAVRVPTGRKPMNLAQQIRKLVVDATSRRRNSATPDA